MFFRRGFPFIFFAPLLLISLFVGMGVLFKVWIVAFLAMFVARMIFGRGGMHHHHYHHKHGGGNGHGHWKHGHHNRDEWRKHKRAMWEEWQGGSWQGKEMSAEEAVRKA